MLFGYQFTTYTLPFPGFDLQLRAATNFEALVDQMFDGNRFSDAFCPYGAALWPAVVASGVQPVEALRKDAAIGAGAVAVKSWPTYLGTFLLLCVYPLTQIPPPVENFPVFSYLALFFILMGVTLLSPLVLLGSSAVTSMMPLTSGM